MSHRTGFVENLAAAGTKCRWNALSLESSMRELGFDVCTVASNEKDAIELAKSNTPDVVLMDVYIGGTRAGIETARWLRGMWRAYRFCDRSQ
jgi:DNA-binding NarL/FixJ family response regulator